MKIIVDIHDPLLEEVRLQASREKTTVRALIEEGLRKIIEEKKQKNGFRLRRATFKGSGLQADVSDASWERIRDITYKRRGG